MYDNDFDYTISFTDMYSLQAVLDSGVPDCEDSVFQSTVEERVNIMYDVTSNNPGIPRIKIKLEYNGSVYAIFLHYTS